MKHLMKLWIIGYFLLCSTSVPAQAQDKKPILLNIKNIQQAKGRIMIAVYDNKQDYMKNPVHICQQKVDALGEQKIVTEMPYGNYAFTVFHDLNDNEELDTNFMGIPKEPYGFSNNPNATFGPPGFTAALVDFQKSNQEIEIQLK